MFLNRPLFYLKRNLPSSYYLRSYFPSSKFFCQKIDIPFDKLSYNYSRSSGPGGQNVNKVNTKVEVRVNLDTATWLDSGIKQRLKEDHKNKINSEGELYLTCSETRSQSENKAILEKKLIVLLKEASKPKISRQFEVSEEPDIKKEFRIKDKKKRSEVKQSRNSFF